MADVVRRLSDRQLDQAITAGCCGDFARVDELLAEARSRGDLRERCCWRCGRRTSLAAVRCPRCRKLLRRPRRP